MTTTRETGLCSVTDCGRGICAKGLCRLHWERQYRTGTTDAPTPRTGSANSAWKGAAATYGAVHLRLTTTQARPPSCEECGTTDGRFEWALREDAPASELLLSPEGLRYSVNPDHYRNLCKTCHNQQDLGRDVCKQGHPLSGENLYIQPSNGKRFCRTCQQRRRRERSLRHQQMASGSLPC